jgi:hypothetical protein
VFDGRHFVSMVFGTITTRKNEVPFFVVCDLRKDNIYKRGFINPAQLLRQIRRYAINFR